MAKEKIKVEIKQKGVGEWGGVVFIRDTAPWLAVRRVAEGQMDKSEELIRVNTERPSWANLALRW